MVLFDCGTGAPPALASVTATLEVLWAVPYPSLPGVSPPNPPDIVVAHTALVVATADPAALEQPDPATVAARYGVRDVGTIIGVPAATLASLPAAVGVAAAPPRRRPARAPSSRTRPGPGWRSPSPAPDRARSPSPGRARRRLPSPPRCGAAPAAARRRAGVPRDHRDRRGAGQRERRARQPVLHAVEVAAHLPGQRQRPGEHAGGVCQRGPVAGGAELLRPGRRRPGVRGIAVAGPDRDDRAIRGRRQRRPARLRDRERRRHLPLRIGGGQPARWAPDHDHAAATEPGVHRQSGSRVRRRGPAAARGGPRQCPRQRLTFGRAISVTDYEVIAAQTPGVSRTAASWTFDRAGQRTLVTISVDGGQAAAAAVSAALSGAGDRNRPVWCSPRTRSRSACPAPSLSPRTGRSRRWPPRRRRRSRTRREDCSALPGWASGSAFTAAPLTPPSWCPA